MAICTTLMGIISIFKSYPSVADLALYLALLSLHTDIFPRTLLIPFPSHPRLPSPHSVFFFLVGMLMVGMRYVFLAFSMLSYASLLGPAFLHLWIYAGSGNANFFYAITLVYSLAQIILVGDALYAMVRVDWEKYEGKESLLKGRKIVQI